METPKRKFNCKDVELLTVCSQIVALAQANLTDIVLKRTTWADPFFPNLKTRIDGAFTTYLGADNAKEMREKTQILKDIMEPAKAGLSTFKINVSADFSDNKPRLNEILTTLGFNAHWKNVKKNDQEALVELLFAFKQNMTPDLKNEITAGGTNGALIASTASYADDLKNANIDQEFAKSMRPQTSAEAVNEFNAIYTEITKVCKICQNMYKDDPVLNKSFSFSAVKRKLSGEAAPENVNAAPPKAA